MSLALIVLCATAELAWRAFKDSQDSLAAFSANQTADLLLQAAGSWAVERGLTNTALNSPTPASNDTQSLIVQRRTAADGAVERALGQISTRPDVKAALLNLQVLRDALSALRTQVDVALAQPMAGRPEGLSSHWIQGVTAVIEASQRLRQDTAFHGATPESRIAVLQQVKHETWIISEYAGRERANLGGLIASSQAMSPQKLLELGSLRGKVDLAWADIGTLVTGPDAPPAIRTAAETMRDTFFVRFSDLRAKVYSSGISGAPYPVTAQIWVAEATSAIDTVLALSRAVGQETADIAAKSADAERWGVWISLAALVIGVAIAVASVLMVVFQVVRPLTRMAIATRQLAAGVLETEVPCQGWPDELGNLAGSVAILRDGMLSKVELERQQELARTAKAAEEAAARTNAEREAAEALHVVTTIGATLERLAGRDLTSQLTAALPGDYDKLRTDLNAMTTQLQSAMTIIVAKIDAIRSGTGEIAQASDDLSRRTEQQAATLEQTSAALELITATVRKTAEGAMRASLSVKETKADAAKSGAIVGEAIIAMGNIESSSNQINQIIGVIDEIAFQTNLLALNAGVEAARAGDSGRGFAVVASEVRALAQRSATAAKEIKALISSSTDQVQVGVKLVREAGTSLDRIVSQVNEITEAVSDMAAAAREQANGLSEVTVGINLMDQATQQNAAMVEQSTAATHALAQETTELSRLTGQFIITSPDAASPLKRAANMR